MSDLDIKVRDACHRIEDMYHDTDGKCYVSFSGGKDSTVILALIKLCVDIYTLPADGIKSVFSNTGIELGVTVDFVNWCKDSGWYSNIEIIRPEQSFDWVIKNQGRPIKSKLKSKIIHQYHYGTRSDSLITAMTTGYYGKKHYQEYKIADKDMHMLHDNFLLKTSSKCCDYMKKKPLHQYEKDNDMRGVLTGIRIAEGGAGILN